MYLHGFIAFTDGDCPPVEEAQFAELPPFDHMTFPQFAAFGGRQKLWVSIYLKSWKKLISHFQESSTCKAMVNQMYLIPLSVDSDL